MVHLFRHILVLWVVLMAFNTNIHATEKRDSSYVSTSVKDSIQIKVNDVSVDDTLVFDDFDEDAPKKDSKSSSGTIASKDDSDSTVHTKTTECFAYQPRKKICNMPLQFNCKGSRTSEMIFFACDVDVTQLQNATTQEETSPDVNMTKALRLTVFPNPVRPSQQGVNIHHNGEGMATVYVRDMQGRLVSMQQTDTKQIQVTGLASGTYLVQLVDEAKRSISKRLLVQ